MFVFNNDEKSYHLLALWLFGFPDFFIFFFTLQHICLILVSTEMPFFLLKFAISECRMKRTKELKSICPCFLICKGEVMLIFCDQQLLNPFCLKKKKQKMMIHLKWQIEDAFKKAGVT